MATLQSNIAPDKRGIQINIFFLFFDESIILLHSLAVPQLMTIWRFVA